MCLKRRNGTKSNHRSTEDRRFSGNLSALWPNQGMHSSAPHERSIAGHSRRPGSVLLALN